MKILVVIFFDKFEKFMPFSGLSPSKLKIFQQKLRVGFVCIEESFDTISIWVRKEGGVPQAYGSGKSPMAERVKVLILYSSGWIFILYYLRL